MTIGQWRKEATNRLRAAGNPDCEADPNWMLCDVLNISRTSIRLMIQDSLPRDKVEMLDAWLARRERGEPLQYILGNTSFMEIKIFCDPRALIPRPETEMLCEAVLTFLKRRDGGKVLDLCAGSGAIGVALNHLCPSISLTFSDLSEDALLLARKNADAMNFQARFIRGDLFESLQGEQFTVIVCNPPYIRTGDLPDLQREVRAEPPMALDGGADGLIFYRRIAAELDDHLEHNGAAFFEVGEGQAEAVARMMEPIGSIEVIDDLRDIPRVVAVYKDGG